MSKILKNKKILVTAGPTWVPIDKVRVISNVSSGLTGAAIADYAVRLGAKVTLLLGPAASDHRPQTTDYRLKVKRFKYFDELKKLISTELTRKKYDILIHVAAVSDYRPAKAPLKKIKSGKKKLVIELRPTVKIVDRMRQQGKEAFLVMFKLEAGKPVGKLVDTAYESMRRARADMIVANNIDEVTKKGHRAYILDKDKNVTIVKTKEELAKKLLSRIADKLQEGDSSQRELSPNKGRYGKDTYSG